VAWAEQLVAEGLATATWHPNRDAPSLLLRHSDGLARGSFARIEHHLNDRHNEYTPHLFVKVSERQLRRHAPRALAEIERLTSRAIALEIRDTSRTVLDALTAAFSEARAPSHPAASTGEPSLRASARPRIVPVDVTRTEMYEITTGAERRTAIQRHQDLMRAFCAYLDRRGRSFESRAVRRAGGEIRCDIYDRTSHVLYEAKPSLERDHARTALGQLFDYSLFLFSRRERESLRLSLLLPERPPLDIRKLAASVGVEVAWRSGERFVEGRQQR
jgi:hypothetical protein